MAVRTLRTALIRIISPTTRSPICRFLAVRFPVAKLLITHYLLNHSPSLKLVGCDLIPATMNWPDYFTPWQLISDNIGFNYDENHGYWRTGLPTNFKNWLLWRPARVFRRWIPLDPTIAHYARDGAVPVPIFREAEPPGQPMIRNIRQILRYSRMLPDQLYANKVHFLMYITPESPYYKNTDSYGRYGPNWPTAEAVIARLRRCRTRFPAISISMMQILTETMTMPIVKPPTSNMCAPSARKS